MEDIHSVLALHKKKDSQYSEDDQGIGGKSVIASYSEIPDIFFDSILLKLKLNRLEIMTLMYLYRRVYNRSNLYYKHGISQLLSHTDMVKSLAGTLEEVHHALRKLEELGLITTIRMGQYFVRKYFTKEYDDLFSVTYDDFEA
jgi:DNA-binding transcriptional ArsR family regulator